MSIRAYKLISIDIKSEESPTFNCWQDNWVLSLADDNDDSNYGLKTFQKDVLQDALEEETLKDRQEVLKAIIKDVGDDDMVEYVTY